MDKLIKDNFIEIKGDSDQESPFFLLKSLMNSVVFILRQQITTRKQKTWTIYTLEIMNLLNNPMNVLGDLEQFFDNVTIYKAAHKAADSMSLSYEQMISNLQSKTLFLKRNSWIPRISPLMEKFYVWGTNSRSVYIGCKSSVTTVIFSLASISLISYQKKLNRSLNIPSR